MTYNEALPWSCMTTKADSSLLEFHQFATREEAQWLADRLNQCPRQRGVVMTTDRANWFKANQVYVN